MFVRTLASRVCARVAGDVLGAVEMCTAPNAHILLSNGGFVLITVDDGTLLKMNNRFAPEVVGRKQTKPRISSAWAPWHRHLVKADGAVEN